MTYLKYVFLILFSINNSYASSVTKTPPQPHTAQNKADDEKYYREGKDLLKTHSHSVNLDGVKELEGYSGDNVSQAALLNNPAGLTNGGQSALNSSELGVFLRETEAQRPMFKDLEKEGYFAEADAVIKDPLKVLDAKVINFSVDSITERSEHTCIEGGEPALMTCHKRRHISFKEPEPKVFDIKIYYYHYPVIYPVGLNILTNQLVRSPPLPFRGNTLNKRITTPLPPEFHSRIIKILDYSDKDNISLNGYVLYIRPGAWGHHYITVKVQYKPFLTEADVIETIEDNCTSLEERADRGECTYESLETIDGPGAKTFEGMTITRPWWDQAYTYACKSCSEDNCKEFRAKGCEQVGSKCHKMVEGRCLEYLQTFVCTKKTINGGTIQFIGQVPYCLDGDCDKHDWAPNGDMAEAISKLAIFKEMQKDMDANSQIVFKGAAKQCRKNCVSFRDCCGSGKGWGKTFGYSCNQEEQALALLRSENKCVFVGTYCAEKVLGKCITKKSSYCCFQTKLAKLIHEQGRRQLGIGWGSAESTQCRALSVNELAKIDFSKIDLSSLYSDIYAKIKVPNLSKITQEINMNMQNNIPQNQEKLKKNLNLSLQNPKGQPNSSLGKGEGHEQTF